MKTQIKHLLVKFRDFSLDKKGRISGKELTRLQDELGVHRATAEKLGNDEATQLRLETIEKLSKYLMVCPGEIFKDNKCVEKVGRQ